MPKESLNIRKTTKFKSQSQIDPDEYKQSSIILIEFEEDVTNLNFKCQRIFENRKKMNLFSKSL